MFIVNKSQEAKFELLAIKFTDRLVGRQLARGRHKQQMENEGLIAEIKKKPVIWDPKDALHYFCILYIIFVYCVLFLYIAHYFLYIIHHFCILCIILYIMHYLNILF